jgi:hypothetical protein
MGALVLDPGALIAIDRGDRALRPITVEPITREDGMRAGELLGATRMKDAIDASVALLAGHGDRVLTSDAGDLRTLCAGAGNKAVVIDC